MAIAIKCQCGKQLQIKDELAGKRIRCPGCGQALGVPMRKPSPSKDREHEAPAKARTQEKPNQEAARPGRQETAAKEEPKPKVKKKKNKSARKSSSGGFNIIPADVPIFKTLFLLILGSLAVWGLFMVFHKRADVVLVSVKAVDRFVPVNMIRGTLPFTPGEREANLSLGGSNQLVLLRDNPAGDHLLIHIRILQTYLSDRGAIKLSSVVVTNRDVILESDTPQSAESLLTAKFEHDHAHRVMIYTGVLGLPGQDRKPADHLHQQLKREGVPISELAKREEGQKETPDIPDGKYEHEFKGIRVAAELSGDTIVATWEPPSIGYYGTHYFEGIEQGLFEKYAYWDFLCLFPRPKGPAKIKAFNSKPIEIKHE